MPMGEFLCSVCGDAFSVPDEVLARYPNWTPKYCRAHSPKKTAAKAPVRRSANPEDMTLDQVLARCTGGPDNGMFTDGSARPNPGPGGWGLVRVKDGQVVAQLNGTSPHTTNNRMELTALIEGLKLLDPAEQEVIYSDSDLCVNILTKWAAGWQARGWRRKTGEIENLDLVQEAYSLFKSRPKAALKWIKAHDGGRWNEYANSLATAWARSEL